MQPPSENPSLTHIDGVIKGNRVARKATFLRYMPWSVGRKSVQRHLGGEQGNGRATDRCQFHELRHQETAIIAMASACMLPTPSRILHGHGGKHRRRVLSVEAASGTGAGTRRGALKQRHDRLVVSFSSSSASHVAAAAGLHSTPRMPHEGRVVLFSPASLMRRSSSPASGGEGIMGYGGGQ